MGKKKITPPANTNDPKAATEAAVSAPVVVKKAHRIERGRIYVTASYNNTVVSVTDEVGNVLSWATAGSVGFTGPKKATPFAASKIISVLAEKLKSFGMHELEVFVKGIGGGRDSAIRSLIGQGFEVSSIKDVTPVPHNGPRPAKTRRV
jgi:small subunit ribosomal protein S11